MPLTESLGGRQVMCDAGLELRDCWVYGPHHCIDVSPSRLWVVGAGAEEKKGLMRGLASCCSSPWSRFCKNGSVQ
jgi:hypothetical protein